MITKLTCGVEYRFLFKVRRKKITHYFLEVMSCSSVDREGDVVHYCDEKGIFNYIFLPINCIFVGYRENNFSYINVKYNGIMKEKAFKLKIE